MTALDRHSSVGQFVTELPGRARIFEQLDIDYCCGGNQSLEEACTQRGLDPAEVLHRLLSYHPATGQEEQTNWSQATLAELTDHIVSVHHQYLRQALPRLTFLLDKVVQAHGERHPELHQLQQVFNSFQTALELHMNKEEYVLFPMCQQLETAQALPQFHCGRIANPIRVMRQEHEEAASDLNAMRALANDFTPPADACNTYRAMLHGLAELEADLHRHVHKENNILFPRASSAELALAARP
ncbi:MAG: iron-sulfur cluster repair di-iron protein [Deinococcus sp.]|nr:iron-sulfur cluster repair di-iron protein [Deinococcus sp.]